MTIIQWAVSAVAILIGAYLIPGIDVTLTGAVVLAVAIALINIFIKPVINLLTLPLNIVTLGLFSLVVNAFIIMLLGMGVPGFVVSGFWSALLFSVIVSLITTLFGSFGKK